MERSKESVMMRMSEITSDSDILPILNDLLHRHTCFKYKRFTRRAVKSKTHLSTSSIYSSLSLESFTSSLSLSSNFSTYSVESSFSSTHLDHLDPHIKPFK